MKKYIINISSIFFLISCSSTDVKVHDDSFILNLFLKKGDIYLDGEFDHSFSTEGKLGNDFYIIASAEAPYPVSHNYIKAIALQKLKEKLLDAIESETIQKSKLITYQKSFRPKLIHSLESKSAITGISFEEFQNESSCHIKQRPRLDLTIEILSECRVRFKFPMILMGGFYDKNN